MEKILTLEDFQILSLDDIIEKYRQGYQLSDNRSLKIALISTPFFQLPTKNYGGLEILVWDLAEALDELGNDVTLLAPEGSRPTKHGHIYITGPSYDPKDVNWLDEETKRYEKYKEFLIESNFDVIHDHSWYGLVYNLKKEYPNFNPNFNSKILHTQHAGFYPEFIKLKDIKQNMIGVSKHMTEITKAHFSDTGSSAQLAYNGIDTDIYKYEPSIKKNNRLLFVSILNPGKGVEDAIEVAKKVNLPLDIITTVPDINYESNIKSLMNDNMIMYKDTTKEFKIKKMQEAKAFLFPTLFEALGLVALESMSCGTPVITFNTNGPNETVIDGKTGFICKDVDEMVEAVKNIDKINPLDCRKRAEEFSRINMAKEHVKLYERAISGDEW